MTAAVPPKPQPAGEMRRVYAPGGLWLPLFLVIGVCLGTDLSRWFQNWQGNREDSSNFMAVAMGDARRLFANQFFVKADAYFHSGFYPTIYDNRQSFETPHIAEDSGAVKGQNTGDENSFLGKPRNWVDAFGRQFYPSVHTHLSEGGADGKEDEGTVGEILPWLKLSSELDPKRVETYVVTSYWLRRMHKLNESEQFLREGLKENPGQPQLLFDLGRLYNDDKHDPVTARNIWDAGLRNLAALPLPDRTNDQNTFNREQILAALAKLESKAGRTNRVIQLLTELKQIAPDPAAVQQWIDDYKGGKAR